MNNLDSKSGKSALLSETDAKNAAAIVTQFILYMQSNAIWPHHQFIGDDPEAVTPDELMIFKRAFIEELKGNK